MKAVTGVIIGIIASIMAPSYPVKADNSPLTP